MENLRDAIVAAGVECVVLEPEYFDRAAVELVVDAEGFTHVKYNAAQIIELLKSEDEMSHEDALEWFYFNIEGAYMGKTTPYYVFPDAEPDAEEE